MVHNLAEEHGLDEERPAAGFRPQFAHDRTFFRFLETLGIDSEVLTASVAERFEAAENTSEPTTSIMGGLSFGRYIFDRLYVDLISEKI